MKTIALASFSLCLGLNVATLGADQALVESNKLQVYKTYPDAKIEGSKLSLAIKEEIARMRKDHPGAFEDPKWPMKVAAVCAAELGIAPQTSANESSIGKTALPAHTQGNQTILTEIADAMPPEEMGQLMRQPKEMAERLQSRKFAAMSKIESQGLYAVVNANQILTFRVNGIDVPISNGTALPFLGFSDGYAWVRTDDRSGTSILKRYVSLMKESEHPELVSNYNDFLVTSKADQARLLAMRDAAALQGQTQALKDQIKKTNDTMDELRMRQFKQEVEMQRQEMRRQEEESRRRFEEMRRQQEEFMNR